MAPRNAPTNWTARTSPDDEPKNTEQLSKNRPPNALENATFFERIFWSWPYPLLKIGESRPLTPFDLPAVSDHDSSSTLLCLLTRLWSSELLRSPSTPSLKRALVIDYFNKTKFIQLVLVLESGIHIFQALSLGKLIIHFQNPQSPPHTGYLWATCITLSSLYVLFAHHIYFFATWRLSMQYKNAAIAMIYNKCSRLKSEVVSAKNVGGKVVNLATNDVERFTLAVIFLPYLIWGPVECLAVLGIGYSLVGPSFLIGYTLLLIFVPMQYYLSQRFATVRSKVAKITDERVSLVSQAVSGVRLMKMSGWEDKFLDRISIIRKGEVKQIQKANVLKAYNEALFFICNIIVAAVIFTAEVVIFEGTLNASDLFTVMTLINIVQFTMTKFFSLGIMGCSEVIVSIDRLEEFLKLKERDPNTNKKCEDGENAIELSGATAVWDEENKVTAVDDVDLSIKKNSLTCVIGPVGSGKSALLQVILSEIDPVKGKLNVEGTVGYASQQPFIVSATVEDNVLFGMDKDGEFYDRVVEAVGLDKDFKRLPHGDQTIIGDRGVNLSGGQKARIGLARAIYARTDIVLLDDVLSAVDVEVGRKIFYSAITDLLLKELKMTVILVTHQHQFCSEPYLTNVLMIGGRVVFTGGYGDCIAKSNGVLSKTMKDDGGEGKRKGNGGGVFGFGEKTVTAKKYSGVKEEGTSVESVELEEKKEADPLVAVEDVIDVDETMIEKRQTGKVSLHTFLSYARAMGKGSLVTFWMVLGMMVVGQVLLILTYTTLGEWAELSPEEQKSSKTLTRVWLFCFFTTIVSFIRTIAAFHYCVDAAKYLHDKMTRIVLRARISFFDTHPMGLVLNRFSADVGTTDDLLVATLFDFCLCGFMSLGGVLTAAYALPIILVCIPFLLFYFVRLRTTFIKSSREIKRVESASRSPVFSMLSEGLNGLTTIRAFPKSPEYFAGLFEERQNDNIRAFFAFIACTRWLGFRLDAICFVLLMCASYLAVVFQSHTDVDIDPAILGLALMMLIQLAGLFQWSVRQSAEAENQMISVERILEYTDLPMEENLDVNLEEDEKACGEQGEQWPNRGKIELRDVSARYRPELEKSMVDVTFVIEGGERVGVVGRTGSGKSTMLQVLFRLLDEIMGDILVDGVDIRNLTLHKYRRSLAVIPQTPTLFNVSLRNNLDPFEEFSDEQILDALECVQMSEVVKGLEGGLQFMLTEGGNNFSVGQQQLLCLSRAILLKSKILVMDESAANVDHLTDKKLNTAVGKVFTDSTIVSIAHRLESIIEYDKVLVMGDGKVLEFGAPKELLDKGAGGVFLGMVMETGDETSKELKRRAAEADTRRRKVIK
ncbi:hypothetical protein TrLO_g10639 [Triparma laevis f. longispina]|uniref:Uncharacterized protein n=1 Tax=Triparma laevis f. longispina TaxID=1714387 RepID=A0A9W7F718_9STRA|nr:hypothetical protein TrLO_g10639 [Triparma laevis f. longispina]